MHVITSETRQQAKLIIYHNFSHLLIALVLVSAVRAPEGSISNFNVQVAGQNYMRENSQYIYQTFYENFYGQAGQINGGQSAGINSCLLNELDYFSSPFIYVNIGRGLASDDLVLKSVQITGLNNSSYYLDLYCFLTYTKTFTIDIRTGALV